MQQRVHMAVSPRSRGDATGEGEGIEPHYYGEAAAVVLLGLILMVGVGGVVKVLMPNRPWGF